jgi:hypothetical protein
MLSKGFITLPFLISINTAEPETGENDPQVYSEQESS